MDSQVTNPVSEASSASATEISAERSNNQAKLSNVPIDASNLTDKSGDDKDVKVEETAVPQDDSQSSASPMEADKSNDGEKKGTATSNDDAKACQVSNASVNEGRARDIICGNSQSSANKDDAINVSVAEERKEIHELNSQLPAATDGISTNGATVRKDNDFVQDNSLVPSSTNLEENASITDLKERAVAHAQNSITSIKISTSVMKVEKKDIGQDCPQLSAVATEMNTTAAEGKEGVSQDNSKPSTSSTDASEARVCEGKTSTARNVSILPLSVSQKGEVNNEQTESSEVASQLSEAPGSNEEEMIVPSRASNKIMSLKEISLRELEQSFLSALNLSDVSVTETKSVEVNAKSSSTTVPTIKITKENGFVEEIAASEFLKAVENKIKTDETVGEEAKSANQTEATSGVSVSPKEKEAETICRGEKRATFYISSSETSPESRNRTPVNSAESCAQPQASRQSEAPTCLGSRALHFAIFLSSIFISAVGYILYSSAHRKHVPEVFEPIGMSTTVISGVVGIFSFVYYSFLGCYPHIHLGGYETIGDPDTVLAVSRTVKPQASAAESWSSETERAFRRQNGMSSKRTSEILARKRVPDKTLVDKVDKLKADISDILDSIVSVTSEKERETESAETQPLINEVVESSNGGSESVSAQSGASEELITF